VGTAGRPGDRQSGGTGARGAVLLVIAVGLGILLLQAFDSGSVPFTDVRTDAQPPTTRRGVVPTVPEETTTTQPPRDPSEVTILAANGTNTVGLGGRTSEFLRRSGYTATLAPTDATRLLDASAVEFVPGFEQEARMIAQLLGLSANAVRPMSDAPPVPDRKDADVLVLIGPDLDRALAGTGTTTTTARP
jgi:hypothetical protein